MLSAQAMKNRAAQQRFRQQASKSLSNTPKRYPQAIPNQPMFVYWVNYRSWMTYESGHEESRDEVINTLLDGAFYKCSAKNLLSVSCACRPGFRNWEKRLVRCGVLPSRGTCYTWVLMG